MDLPVASSRSHALAQRAHEVKSEADYDALIEQAGSARFVLIGEASHGTQEFYATRAMLTRRLIAEKGFHLVLLEADWPDTLRVHRYVNGRGKDKSATKALSDFRRFPAWMWRNTVMVEFVEWTRQRNLSHPREPVGIFGMDLYSMHTSIAAVLDYLEKTNPAAARRARKRYECFELFGTDPQAYGYATVERGAESCEHEVIAQLADLRRHYGEFLSRDGQLAEDEFFYAEQNARLVANAERYYRSMFYGRDLSWNLRDEHMTETLDAVARHFENRSGKIIVWAHNSHLGDARATSMSERGEWNVGHLLRERHPGEVYAIGFSTYSGTVTAARDWGAESERRVVRPGLPGSCEELFHETGLPVFWLDLKGDRETARLLEKPRLQRAIGVIYRPETERGSHYFEARLAMQFDAIIHIDHTTALHPLERSSEWDAGELPETYPSAL